MPSAALFRFAVVALVRLAKAQCTDDLTAACCAAAEAQLNVQYEAHLAQHNVDAGGEFDMQSRHRYSSCFVDFNDCAAKDSVDV
jgi:hypothetical protein